MAALDCRVGFIGAGAMGGSIARGLVSRKALTSGCVAASDPSPAALAELSEMGCATFSDALDMIASFDPELVLIAVKPQVLADVVGSLADVLSGRLVVSIAAGVSLATLASLLPQSRVVRCMPNLPMQVGSGAVAITPDSSASEQDVQLVLTLFSVLGVAHVMREDQLDVAGVVAGSSPAFFALFVDCLTRAGVEHGMSAQACREMVVSTMRGVAEQLLSLEMHPRAYMELVTSPGGTTAQGLRAMESNVFYGVEEAVDAALERTRELSEA